MGMKEDVTRVLVRGKFPADVSTVKAAGMYVKGRRDGNDDLINRAKALMHVTCGNRAGEIMRRLDEELLTAV